MKKIHLIKCIILFCLIAASTTINSQEEYNKWKPDWENLMQYEVPEWLLDAKLGIQYVGAPRNFNDQEYWFWNRTQQRARLWETDEDYINLPDEGYKRVTESKKWWSNYVSPVEYDDPKKAIEKYVDIGAKYIVSMLRSAYFATEGLLMTDEEIKEARKQGLKVGLHYNFMRREGQPSFGDPGYVNWMIPMLKKAIIRSEADFVFFDMEVDLEYLRVFEFIAWYYNWADKKGKKVWTEQGKDFDWSSNVLRLECQTMSGVSPKMFIIWDELRNDWNCFINDRGIHIQTGEKWVWQYKDTDDLLQMFIDVVSKGGGWLIQMVNTKKAWETLEPIGKWLKVNGEAIYNTRPYFKVSDDAKVTPGYAEAAANSRFQDKQDWWNYWRLVCKEVNKNGPLYFNKSKDGKTLYAIHWGWPGQRLFIQNVTPLKGSTIKLLGSDTKLEWKQIGSDIIIHLPDARPCDYAYSFKIQLEE
jgi:alpha-L-fucosidase